MRRPSRRAFAIGSCFLLLSLVAVVLYPQILRRYLEASISEDGVYFELNSDGWRLWSAPDHKLDGTDLLKSNLRALESFDTPGTIYLWGGTKVTDETLRVASQISSLRELDLRHCKLITGTGLKHLRSLPDLQSLNLSDTNIDPHSVRLLFQFPSLREIDLWKLPLEDAHLQGSHALKTLRSLRIGYSDVGDEGLRSIARNQEIEELHLNFTKVTDVGISYLADLKYLNTLELWGNDVGDSGLSVLARLPSLRNVELYDTNVTDKGVKELVNLREIDELNLYKTSVTDAALSQLEKLDRLGSIYLYGTKVTEAGIRSLEARFPDMILSTNPWGVPD